MTETITLIANVSLALSFVAALIFGVAQVRQSERDRRERLTLDTVRNFQTREFAELIRYISTDAVPTSPKEMQGQTENERIMFIQFAQQMESLGIMVAMGFINLNLVEKTLGSFVTTSWEKYKPTFLAMRERDPYLGEYFQFLAERIERSMKENPRTPAYKRPIQI